MLSWDETPAARGMGVLRCSSRTQPDFPGWRMFHPGEAGAVARILVIDDDGFYRGVIRRILEDGGHQVLETEDGREAVDLYRQFHPDVVVTDIFMPELDGLELIRLARITDPAVRIVAMSDYDRHSGFHVLAIAEQLGADATLPKPIETAQLLNAVAALPCEAARVVMQEEEMTNAAEF